MLMNILVVVALVVGAALIWKREWTLEQIAKLKKKLSDKE